MLPLCMLTVKRVVFFVFVFCRDRFTFLADFFANLRHTICHDCYNYVFRRAAYGTLTFDLYNNAYSHGRHFFADYIILNATDSNRQNTCLKITYCD